MPLLDHFHPPLSGARHWESFHAAWAGSIADSLNRDLLPPGYFAEEHVHVGSRVEVDVATFDATAYVADAETPQGGIAMIAAPAWTARAPTLVWPAIFPDSLEVLVYSSEAGPTLVAAIDLVSPANKDRPDERRAFAAKCASYLHQGVGLVVVDIVTNRHANLHEDIGRLLNVPETPWPHQRLYATAYRPLRREDGDRIDVWTAGLEVGHPLPVVPMALDKSVLLPLDLNAAYDDACDRRRLSQYLRP